MKPANANLTILIVDDEPDLAEVIEFDLRRDGFRSITANGAKQALKILSEESVDAIASDLRMPDGDGIELLQQVRKLHPNIPFVLFVSGYTDITIDDFYDRGVSAILSKPLDPKKLSSIIRRSIENRDQRWKRAIDRHDIDEAVSTMIDGRGELKNARASNVGRGGIFIEMDADCTIVPRIGDIVHFSLRLEQFENILIEGSGIVRWARSEKEEEFGKGIGVEFETLSDKSRMALTRAIHELNLNAFIPRGAK